VDERLAAGLVVSTVDPRAAAAEIRRRGGGERVVQVAFAFPGELLGDRALYPIYEAAQEHGLAVCLQAGGAFSGSNRGLGAGVPSTLFEYEAMWIAAAQPHLLSFAAQRVFDRFPGLRLVLDGFGAAWLPSLLCKLADEHRAHVRERVRTTPVGLELPDDPAQREPLLALAGAGQMLAFASGPGRAPLEADALLAGWPEPLRTAVLCENAAALSRTAGPGG
jgi:hypothetical protein